MSDFVKADGRNLPKVDFLMLMTFIKTDDSFNIAEAGGWKAGHSMRKSYIDSAIGWVDLKREDNICTVRAKICPEHKVRAKLYELESAIDEREEKIIYVKCKGCAASAGCCKHATAFLKWLCDQYDNPSPTETECYWKRLKLAKALTSGAVTLEKFGKVPCPKVKDVELCVQKYLSEKGNTPFANYEYLYSPTEFHNLNLHRLSVEFHSLTAVSDINAKSFLQFVKNKCCLDLKLCQKACNRSIEQSNCPLWHSLRYGRITASIIYEASRAQENKSLIHKIMGVSKIPLTHAIKRGTQLEKFVVEEVSRQLKIKFNKSGFLIPCEKPNFGASPDGVSEEFVLEVKCPSKEDTVKNYVVNGIIRPKVKAQIHLQMYVFNKKKGILAVANPNFENNRKVTIIQESFDASFFEKILSNAEKYWSEKIFPKFIK